MRCPDCCRFVGLETLDPEVDLDVSDAGTVSASVRVARACSDCGGELKECSFDVDETLDLPAAEGDHVHELQVEEGDVEATETGGSRYQKNMVGFRVSWTVSCAGCDFKHEGEFSDAAPAGTFDELV